MSERLVLIDNLIVYIETAVQVGGPDVGGELAVVEVQTANDD